MDRFGFTQAQLAALIGGRQSTVGNWMNGAAEMPQSTAMAFQTALGIRWQWILTGEGALEAESPYIPEDLKELATLWPRLTEKQRQHILGFAQGILAAGESGS